MPRCPQCGREGSPEARFCSGCGFELASLGTPLGPPPLFSKPVVRIFDADVWGTFADKIDLKKAAKALPRVTFDPRSPHVLTVWLTDPRCRVDVSDSGKVRCPDAASEADAKRAILAVVAQLGRRIPLIAAPAFEVRSLSALTFFGRGIQVQLFPERIPNSVYLTQSGARDRGSLETAVQGRYNKAGQILQLNSRTDAMNALKELGSLRDPRYLLLLRSIPIVACCRLPDLSVAAVLPRGLNNDGSITMTGYAALLGARSDAEAQSSVARLGGILERAGLFTALTPLEQLPQKGRDDPRAYDYFANDPAVWLEAA